jgi:hypothetical protein
LERIDRERCNVKRRIRLARVAQIKSLDTFDFVAQPSLNEAQEMSSPICCGSPHNFDRHCSRQQREAFRRRVLEPNLQGAFTRKNSARLCGFWSVVSSHIAGASPKRARLVERAKSRHG